MDFIIQGLTDWLKEILVSGIMGNLTGMFDAVNQKVGEVSEQVGLTPQAWNGDIFSMIQNLSETVMVPIAGVILAFVMTLELIQLIVDKNNFHDIESAVFFKWIFKSACAILIVTNTWDIVMGVFDLAQGVVNNASGVIIGDAAIDISSVTADLEARLMEMDLGPLFGLWFQSLFVGMTMWALVICIFIITFGRMIEIYLVTSLAPVPMATMMNHEWGQMGQNYLRSLFALGFQAFLIIVCVAIYAVLVQNIALDGDVSYAIWTCMVQAYDERTGKIVAARARDIRIEKYADELKVIELEDGTTLRCTDTHLIMDAAGRFVEAGHIREGQHLSGGHVAVRVSFLTLAEKVPVYDLSVPQHLNFLLENGLIVHNSGKSFSAKREITNAFLLTSDDIFICDPEGEYFPLVERLDGQVIRIAPTSTDYINPMDINLNYSDDDNPLSLKADFILSLCELIVGNRDGLEPVEKTVIDRCVRIIYQPYLNDPKPENIPILGDLYQCLLDQEEREAHRIATALEIYVSGSLNVFNHRTNVDVNNRIVCYDIKGLGKQLKKLGMLIVQDQVWGRVTENRSAGKYTRYYMDEFHLLLAEEQTAAYSVEIWARFRKWGGIPTGITQNVKNLLSSREVENIFENSDFIYMLNQAAGDRQILAKHLNISPHQLSYVTHSGEGEGLLFYGNVILPFIDRFPKDTELYKIMTTKPQEVSG